MTTTFVRHGGNCIYIFVRGLLVMNRWFSPRVSATFHVARRGVHWSRHEFGVDDSPESFGDL